MKKLTTVFLTLILVSACGWQLRGTTGNLEILGRVLLLVDNNAELQQQLGKSLSQNRAQLTDQADQASYQILINNYRSERRTVAYNRNGSAAEYALRHEMRVTIIGPAQQTLIQSPISIERSYRFDPDNVLSKQQEEALLQTEIQQDIGRQIVRQLQTAHRKNTEAL